MARLSPASGFRLAFPANGGGRAGIRWVPSEESWPESTAYTLSLAKLPLPSRMKLASPSAFLLHAAACRAPEMDGRLWIDPDLNGEQAVSF